MKLVIQRVLEASLKISDKEFSRIDQGFLILVGFTEGDNIEKVDYFVKKIPSLRIFEDENGLTNKSITDVLGSVMLVSQFTLYANTKKGNRPSFIEALNPEDSIKLYNYFTEELGKEIPLVTGVFGEDMKISLINDGPMTIIMEK